MTIGERCRDGAIMAVVAALSLFLLIYVGWGEAKRTYPRFQAEKMVAQGELVQTALDAYLRAGLPLAQFPGFRQIAEPIRESDPTIAAIVARNPSGRSIFSAGDAAVPQLPGQAVEGRFAMRDDGTWLQVALPLRNRFEAVGELTVTMPRATIAATVDGSLPLLAALGGGLAVLFGVFAAWIAPRTLTSRVPWIGGAYALVFILTAAAVVATLVDLYAEGAQAKAKALADSLSQRIEPLLAYGLDLRDIEGLDRTLAQYRALNPDIKAVGVTLEGRVAVHSDAGAIGQPWQSGTGTFEYVVPVGARGDIRVAVSLPAEIVWGAVGRSAKNFAALFLASALMAGLFLGVARSLETRGADAKARRLALVRPIFFVAVFIENLAAGFLPQLLRRAATDWGLGQGAASTAFTAYFLAFLLVLLPVSAWVDRKGPRSAIVGGALLAACASLIPVATLDFGALVAARALAGLGQGLLFIGVQAAVLANAPAGQRTRAAAIIVFGFNGGMIAGAAIGSLLVNDLAAPGVFALGAAVALLLAAYAGFAAGAPPARTGTTQTFGQLVRDIPRAFASLGFLRAFLLVGAPSKAVLTGVVAFAMPLLLAGLGWAPEDIGQIIMLYAAGVLLSSGFVARLVDRTGGSRSALVAGGLASALGLALVGAVGLWTLPGLGQAALVVGGTLLLGLAHGCINAPVITYVGDSGAADRLGQGGATALYRVVERAGHVLGPVLAGQVLLAAGGGAMAILWIGGFMLVCAVLFALPMGEKSAVREV